MRRRILFVGSASAASSPSVAAAGSRCFRSIRGSGLCLTLFCFRVCALRVCSLAAEAGLIRDLNSFGKEHKFKREA